MGHQTTNGLRLEYLDPLLPTVRPIQTPNKIPRFVFEGILMNIDPVRHLRGLRGKDLALGIALTPLLIPIWTLVFITRPLRWAYEETMTRMWGGR